ncbi:MAG: hypothetical protein ACOCVM_07480, partial [Desulfovibrionaceae bacterium]
MSASRCLLAVCLVLVSCFPAFGDDDPAASDTWRSIIRGVEESIGGQQRYLDASQRELPALYQDLSQGLSKAEERLNQVLLLKGVAGETPWAYRTIYHQLVSVQDYVEMKKRPLEQRKATLLQSRQDYEYLSGIERKSREHDPDSPTAAALSGPVDDLHRLKQEVLGVKGEINESLAPSDALLERINHSRNATLHHYYGVLAGYYFTPSVALWSFEGLQRLRGDLFEWVVGAPRFWLPLLEWVHWGEFFSWTAFVFAGLFVPIWLVVRWVARRRQPALDSGGLLLGFAWLALSAAILEALDRSFFTTNQLTMMAIPVLATLGALRLTHVLLHSPVPIPTPAPAPEDETEEGEAEEEGGEAPEAPADETEAPAAEVVPAAGPAPAGRSPLFPLWALMSAGALLQVLNTPATVLQVVWPVCLALAAWRVRRRARSVEEGPEWYMLRLSFWVLLGLTAAAVLDMAAMALVLAQAWFMLLAT